MVDSLSIELVLSQLQADFLPMAIYALAIVLYGIIVWNFYSSLGRRDIFHAEHEHGIGWVVKLRNSVRSVSLFLDYLIVFPLISVIWFCILSLFMILFSSTTNIQEKMIISVALIFATRIAAYYNEDLAKDLAKIIPFGLLGVYLADPKFFSLDLAINQFMQIQNVEVLSKISVSIALIIMLEWGLRLLYKLKVLALGEAEDGDEVEVEEVIEEKIEEKVEEKLNQKVKQIEKTK